MTVFDRHSLPLLLALPDEACGPQGDHPCVAVALCDLDEAAARRLAHLPCPVIGVGQGPHARFVDVIAPTPDAAEALAVNIAQAPFAAMVLVQTLRAADGLAPSAALTLESLAFATLQFGPDFRSWLNARGAHPPAAVATNEPSARIARAGCDLRITLNRPDALNAVNVPMRDALVEAFDLALLDGAILRVTLDGAGRCFSIGGDLSEFGRVADPTTAHWVRTLRGPAGRLSQLRDRLTARVQGGVVGAGLEMAAFAGRLVAAPDAWFQLPELRYGLIPGAGGTVSVTARVGRQRTAWLALSMRRINASTALAWGLVDAIES